MNVVYDPGLATSCGFADPQTDSQGVLTGGTITLFRAAALDPDCTSDPNKLGSIMAHEIGHFLGLSNTAIQGCDGYIMGPLLPNMSVHASECDAAGDAFMTPTEETSEPSVPDPPMPTPIVIKLSPGSFRFCGLDDGVEFDFDADGLPETTTWTHSGWDGAFLVLDRNGNGEVDDGTELFGNFTNQPASEEPNGFRALAVFDGSDSGGNEDGRISEADLIFAFLRLWKDSNHDGISQASELVPLSWRGVVAIGLDTLVSGAQDRHGNVLRWRSLVDFETRTGLAAVDVIFVLAE